MGRNIAEGLFLVTERLSEPLTVEGEGDIIRVSVELVVYPNGEAILSKVQYETVLKDETSSTYEWHTAFPSSPVAVGALRDAALTRAREQLVVLYPETATYALR